MESALAGNHLVQNRAEGKNVRPRIGRLSSHLFRRHVAGRAHDQARFGYAVDGRRIGTAHGFRTSQLGQAEVQNLHSTIAGDEQIFRLQVAMHDALLVRRRQSPRHLQPVFNRLADRKRAIPQTLAQRLTFQQFGDHVGRALLVPDIEDRKNVGMIERSCGSRFLGEALHAVLIRRERCRQDFDGHGAIQPRIFGAIHFAHATRTDQRLDFVGPQLRS